MKKLLLVLLVTVLTSVNFAHAEVQTEKRKEIEKMLRLSGAEKMMGQMLGQIISGLKKQMPQVPDEFWTKFMQKVDPRELAERIIPIYDKYYTLDDLKAINAFYESPSGKKVLAALPQIMMDSNRAGQEWGAKLAKQAAEEVEKESKDKESKDKKTP
jgi:uncharacterized protein